MATIHTLFVLVVTLLVGVQSAMTSEQRLAAANSDFALRLYVKVIYVLDDENIFLSPFSISTALAMTSGGARGNTANEMIKVLGFDNIDVDIHGGFRSLLQTLNSSVNGNYTLALANRLFPDSSFGLVQDFADMTLEKYAAAVKPLDFAGSPDASRTSINEWVADKTEQKIKDLLSSRDISSETVLVLANAIYFKGSWLLPFNVSYTTPAPFYVSADLSANVNMMQTTGKFRYNINAELGCRIVELPYGGTDLSMVIFVPEAQDGLSQIERKLTVDLLNSAIDSLQETHVQVKLPKFNITKRVDLVNVLSNMGMKDLFKSGSANLSGLAVSPASLAVSGVIHKAYISVDEEGTEAAAATAVVVTRGRTPTVDANRPFLFLIREKATGTILFLGRLIQPPVVEDSPTPNSAARVSCLFSTLMLLLIALVI